MSGKPKEREVERNAILETNRAQIPMQVISSRVPISLKGDMMKIAGENGMSVNQALGLVIYDYVTGGLVPKSEVEAASAKVNELQKEIEELKANSGKQGEASKKEKQRADKAENDVKDLKAKLSEVQKEARYVTGGLVPKSEAEALLAQRDRMSSKIQKMEYNIKSYRQKVEKLEDEVYRLENRLREANMHIKDITLLSKPKQF